MFMPGLGVLCARLGLAEEAPRSTAALGGAFRQLSRGSTMLKCQWLVIASWLHCCAWGAFRQHSRGKQDAQVPMVGHRQLVPLLRLGCFSPACAWQAGRSNVVAASGPSSPWMEGECEGVGVWHPLAHVEQAPLLCQFPEMGLP